MRGSDPDAAVYYLAAMLEGGEDPRFLARRIVIAASEDVGNADPRALLVAVAAAQAVEHVGLPEAQLNLAQAAIYVARAPKSNATAQAIWTARADVRREGIAAPPAMLRDAHYRGATHRGHGVGYASPHGDPTRAGIDHLPEDCAGARTIVRRPAAKRQRRACVAIATGDRAPEFDLEEASDLPRVRLADYLGRSNVLLVFHPFAYTAICAEEALDLQENLESFRNANTEIVFVSCDASAARQAWKSELGAEYTFASDFWAHGATAKRYGVFDETTGAPIRGTFLIDTDGVVIWSLVRDTSARRTEMVPESLETSAPTHDRPWTAPGHSTALPVRSHRERDDAAPGAIRSLRRKRHQAGTEMAQTRHTLTATLTQGGRVPRAAADQGPITGG